MAKIFKSSLPKVISKANRDISTIIENDIANESAILKNLVDEVLAANMEVKKKNNQRILETKRKLQELDIEIDELNTSIELVDRETVIEQLNQMIDAENKIFKARHEIRFFENEDLPSRLDNLNRLYLQLDSSIDKIGSIEASFSDTLRENNDLLFNKQVEVTTHILHLIRALNTDKKNIVLDSQKQFQSLYDSIDTLEKEFFEFIKESINQYRLETQNSDSIFSNEDNDDALSEKIKEDHKATVEKINAKIELINQNYNEKRDDLTTKYNEYEDQVRLKFQRENELELERERKNLEAKDEELRNIRLLIIDAEKKQDIARVQKLMKQFEKVERTKESSVTDKTDKEFNLEVKKTKEKTIKQLQQLLVKYVTDLNKQELQLELERIKYEESKILFKIKTDYDGLVSDLSLNQQRVASMELFLQEQEKTLKQIYKYRLNLRLSELEVMKQNEMDESDLIEQYRTLLLSLKDTEYERKHALENNHGNHERIRIEQQFHVKKTVLDLKLNKEISDIDKLILKKQNESIIRIEKLREEANSDVIYQESLIKIAKKERELQLVKVNSLYENERSLAEEQVERIGLGVQVNDKFVKTTLENQLLFATQQIKCADSEFDIRVESINLTKDQELAYANKKIEYYRQKYDYEKSKIIKERDDKLEDLNFKLLLFTEEKENQKLTSQINTLKSKYQVMIDEIEALEGQDEEIIRYEKVIDAAETRAQLAIEEATALRAQTKDAFEALYDQTKLKYDQIVETNRTEETVGIMPLLNTNAVSSADDRLQQAIKEADELYEERILEPTRIIKEKKQLLLDMTQESDIDTFCDQQRQVKQGKIELHQETIKAIEEEREMLLNAITKPHETSSSEQDKERLFNLEPYRTKEQINVDYEDVKKADEDFIKSQINDFSVYKKNQVEIQRKLLKTTTNQIKAVLKPYKKYIRSASRGLNAEKRELNRKNKRQLKKLQSQALDKFESPIN